MSNHDRGGPEMNRQRPSADDALEGAWRSASDEQPSAQLDAAILAAARQTVADRRVKPAAVSKTVPVRAVSRFRRWQPLAVAASVAGLAFALVQTLPREPDFQPSSQAQKSVSIPASPPPTQRAVQPESNVVPEPRDNAVDHPQPRAETRDLAPAQRAVAPPPLEPATAPPLADTARSSNEAAAGTGMAAASAPAREKSASNAAKRLDATDWVAGIEAQYAAGDVVGAADRLRAFRAVDPEADQYLSDTLRVWARSVE